MTYRERQARFDRSIATTPGGRAARSGTATTPNASRRRPLVHLSLSPEAIARLDQIAEARGTTRSGAVEQLVRNARLAKD